MTATDAKAFSWLRLRESPSLGLQTLLAYLALICQPFIFFKKVLFSRTGHIPYDIELWHQPIAAFLARCLREHRWPAWNPFSACGAPVYADPQAQMFYSITWIALIVSNLTDGKKLFFWLEALVPLHMCLGGIFLYLFLRRLELSIPIALLGGTIYELSAFFASQAQHLTAICTAAYFPLLLLCALELTKRLSARYIGLTALSFALLLLAGFPQCTIVAIGLTFLFALALVITRSGRWLSIAALAGGILLGACICAVQLIPTLEAIPLTIAKLRGEWHIGGGGLPLQSLASFVSPNFYYVFAPFDRRFDPRLNFTFMYTYCGHAAVLLIACVPFVLLFRKKTNGHKLIIISTLLMILSAIWMLGDSTPVYKWVYAHLPRSIRGSLYSEYALMGFCLWVAITAALVLQELRLKHSTAIAWIVALLTGANLISVSSNRPMNTAKGGYKSATTDNTIAGDSYPVQALQRLTRSENPPLRIDLFPPGHAGLRGGSQMYRIPSALADDPFNVLSYYYFRLSLTGDNFWERVQALSKTKSRWIDALNVGYIVGTPSPGTTVDERFEPVPVRGLDVWKNRTPLPRFYLVDRIRRAASTKDAMALLPRISDPETEAIVEGLNKDWTGSGANGGSVRVVKYEDNHVDLAVNAPGPSYLVSSEIYYPGWKATQNGRPVDLLPTNLAFRGMPVPAGATNISMNFQVDYLPQSIALSIVALLTAAILIAVPSQARRT